jgi:ABC-type antimicrobial peptide transport system permease subunit
MMLRQAAILSAIGIFVGIALALPMSRLVGGFLFGVEPLDPLTLVWGAAALATVQMLAGWGPARRSARDSILETLRD